MCQVVVKQFILIMCRTLISYDTVDFIMNCEGVCFCS